MARYSTAGLRKNLLDRAGKKLHLQSFKWSNGSRRFDAAEIEAVLAELYPEEKAA